MAKRRSKARGKASKSRRKTKKPMTNAKPATRRKTRKAKSRRKVTGKAATKRRRKTAAMQSKPIVIPVKTGAIKTDMAPKTGPANPLGINLPAMPFPYSRDSVMNVLVGMLILFAVVSAGILYPQTPKTEQALTAAAPGMMQKK